MDEGDPLIPLEEHWDDDDGNTTQPFQPGASSTSGPSGECYLMHTTTMNRTPERRHIQVTSVIRAFPRGQINNPEDQRIIGAQSILEGLYPDYNSKGAVGYILKFQETKEPGQNRSHWLIGRRNCDFQWKYVCERNPAKVSQRRSRSVKTWAYCPKSRRSRQVQCRNRGKWRYCKQWKWPTGIRERAREK